MEIMRTMRIAIKQRGILAITMKHPAGAAESAKINMVYPLILLRRIDTFWHKHQFKNRTAAILWLLDWALSQKPAPDTKSAPKAE
jgi:hypothetical protein